MSDLTRLVVVRHGNTFEKGDVILRVGARTDLPLTETGRAQGRDAGRRLAERNLTPDAYFYAPLKRTQATCEEIASVFANAAPSRPLEFLTELDYGEDDGRPEEEVLAALGSLGENNRLTRDDLIERGREVLRRWDSEGVLPFRWGRLNERVAKLGSDWREFAAATLKERRDQTTVAVTSNGIARFALALLPEEAPRPESLKLGTGKFGVFLWDDARSVWTLEDWNV